VTSILLVVFTVYLYLFLQPLKLAASNLVYNLGLGCSLSRKKTLGPKLAGVFARGASRNIWDLLISATVEFGNFKFGAELGFEKYVAKNHF